MIDKKHARFALLVCVAACGLAASGCMGSPTYGTDKTANAQLMEDVTGIMSLGPKERPPIAYTPRPELVKPASTEVLPAPQDSVLASNNPAWPESPEQKRARLRAEADANSRSPTYDSPIVDDVYGAAPAAKRPAIGQSPQVNESGIGRTADTRKQREAYNAKLAEARQGSETQRRFLSEPPLVYRAPSADAPVGDVGEDEWRKERRLKRQASKSSRWRDLLPW